MITANTSTANAQVNAAQNAAMSNILNEDGAIMDIANVQHCNAQMQTAQPSFVAPFSSTPTYAETKLNTESASDTITQEKRRKNNLGSVLKSALVKYAKNENLDRNQALKLYDYFNSEIKDIKHDELTYHDYVYLVSRDCITFESIPSCFITSELCSKACEANPDFIRYVPSALQTETLWFKACVKEPSLIGLIPAEYLSLDLIKALPEFSLHHIPMELRTKEVYLKAIKSSPYNMRKIPKDHLCYAEFLAHLTKIHGVYLEYFDAEKITQALCQKACLRYGGQLEHVPARFKNFELCKIAVKSEPYALKWLPSCLTDQEQKALYKVACSASFQALKFIPECDRTQELCLLACESGLITQPELIPMHLLSSEVRKKIELLIATKDPFFIDRLKEELFTEELCLEIASHEHFELSAIPYKFWSDQLWEKLSSKPYVFKNDFNYKIFDRFKHLIKFLPKNKFLALFEQCPSFEEKLKLIDFMDSLIHEAEFCSNSDKLLTLGSPLNFIVKNPYMQQLVENAHAVTPLKFNSLGTKLKNYLADSLIASSAIFDVHSLFHNHSYQMVGGRTIEFYLSSNESQCLKFKKTNEDIEELIREGNMYQFIENDSYLSNKLKSKLPHSISLEKIQLNDLIESEIKKSEDEIEIIQEGNKRYVYALSYKVASDYSRYAHFVDAGSQNNFEKPEQGIIAACHDCGVLASMGMILPSLLPAFHDTISSRRWVALHSGMNARGYNHSGTFGAWNTTATSRPDFGYGGLRDLGDHEFYGEIKTCLQQSDTKQANKLHADEALQRIGFSNAICETLLGALLVRSRLRQQGADYHYTNQKCLNETKQFIESICEQFLSGFAVNKSENSKSLLQNLLLLDDAKYSAWLERSALEIVYWTSTQAGIDKVNGQEPSLSEDCYLKHIEKTGDLSSILYPPSKKSQNFVFLNINGKLNLGANNMTFPFISFMNGLTLLCVNLLAQNRIAFN